VTSAYQFLNSDGEREVVAVAWIPSADLFMGTDSATRELRITWSIADSIIGSARTDESLRVPASARGGGLLSASTVWSGSDATGVTLRVVAVDAQDSMRAGTGSTAIALHDPGVAGISDLV